MDDPEEMSEQHIFRCASCGDRFSRDCDCVRCPVCGSRTLIHESGPPLRKRSKSCSGSCSGCSGCRS